MRMVLFILGLLAVMGAAYSKTGEDGFGGLLQEIKQIQQQEASVRHQRREAFVSRKEQQAALLEQARKRLDAERQRSGELKRAFELNEQELSQLESDLQQRVGDLGEVFGALRQTARDLAPVVKESLVSAQFHGRAAWLEELGESKRLPEMARLEKLWTLMQGEIVESGQVVRMHAEVIDSSGMQRAGDVVRVGLFNALHGDNYLRYQPETGRFVELSRQPDSSVRALAGIFSSTEDGYAELALDPTRGVLLGLMVETPDHMERLHQGGMVGYVILALGGAGLLVVLFRLVYLWFVGRRIHYQLKRPTEPSVNNPLGRVLEVANQTRTSDPANLELQIDEAVLRELPQLTRGEGVVKLLAGVAPLLGLLGTVVGMIVTFQAISLFGTGDPKLMANGISQALVTTALGLIVAIPLLFLHSLLSSRSRLLVQILDEQSAGLVAAGRESQ